MNMQELKELIYQGEKVDIECKKAEKNVPKSAYESYSAFANTKGGALHALSFRLLCDDLLWGGPFPSARSCNSGRTSI